MPAQPPLTAKLDDERLEAGITTQGTDTIECIRFIRRHGMGQRNFEHYNTIFYLDIIAQCFRFLAHLILILIISFKCIYVELYIALVAI